MPEPEGRNPLWQHHGVVLALGVVSLVLVLAPLSFGRPGLPSHLKADEAAYFGMAQSLAWDRDLRFEARDSERVLQAFPYQPVRNLIVVSDDGWRTVFFGKPYLYPLLAAPLVRLLGPSGALITNALLFTAAIWLGAAFLARRVPAPVAAAFAAGFFLLSAATSYLYWIQPEVLSLLAVTAALASCFERERPAWLLASGAALAVAGYHKPMILLLALPLAGAPLLRFDRRSLRGAAAWALGCALGLGAAALGCWLLTGHPTAYLGVARQGMTICEPGALPAELRAAAGNEEGSPRAEAGGAASPPGAWNWLVRVPDVTPVSVLENLGYFLVGRHAGRLPYFPFAGITLLLFVRHGLASRARWLLALALFGIALYFVVFIDWNWQGGGGFVGNRYYVSVVPGFLFLVRRVRARTVVLGAAVAALLVGPLLLHPLGAPVPEPTLQAHTRNWPLRALPYELSLRNVPGYAREHLGSVTVVGRSDQVLRQGDALWLHGNAPVELLLLAGQPLPDLVLQVRSPLGPNRVRVGAGGRPQVVSFAHPNEPELVTLEAEPYRVRRQHGGRQWVYRVRLRTERGTPSKWLRTADRGRCSSYASNERLEETFWLGAEVVLLGSSAELSADLYPMAWRRVEAPPRVLPGEEFEAALALTNHSQVTWPHSGAARVRIGYRWLRADARVLVPDGGRADFAALVAPGETAALSLRVRAPEEAGRFLLEVEPVYEHVAWFGQRNQAARAQVAVEVAAPDAAPP